MSESTSQKLLAIPGPIPLSPTVQRTLALAPLSHVSPEFVKVFQESLDMTRQVVHTTATSPALILAGSGTLGWDQVGANLVEPGDRVLVLHTGYFGDGFKEWCVHTLSIRLFFPLYYIHTHTHNQNRPTHPSIPPYPHSLETYGATVDVVQSILGGTVKIADIESALRKRPHYYKMVTITHVDTSTGVLSDARAIAACVRRVSPGTLVILDAVCSLASEDVQMDAWGLDVVLSASQKGLGAPPGLSILVASPRTMDVWTDRVKRGVKSGSYYSSWEKWIPIMRAYDQGKPAYFGTPAVNILRAYHASLSEITKGPVSLSARLQMHVEASDRVKRAAERLGMVQVATEAGGRAHGMTALYVPQVAGLTAADVLGGVGRRGVVMAGGLVKEVKERYIRIGHMGWSVVGECGRDVDVVIKALEEAVREAVKSKSVVSARL
ncbi:pyridoxal phosphate-dependent transferase [Flammula alnicola]|nr:pyridoxal phosphate-dependent transferase [Flammula alnicola]